ncbi:MAG: hypothetical protein OEV00_12405 [Acidobacteriota bacterium]|nr:hypothetical protein [Acidobacteriota bacterium]MDH3786113.1 hypothetical protein [Acidobacteriota bacterium]
MYCPQCRDEFREGFTRCATCDVDLIADLESAPPPERVPEKKDAARHAAVAPQMLEYCGFLDLNEARTSRDQLRAESIRADILVREAPDAALDAPTDEEYWLRIESQLFRRASEILRPDAPVDGGEGTVACRDCGLTVSRGESFCPACGTRL